MEKTTSGVVTLPSWMRSVKKLYNTRSGGQYRPEDVALAFALSLRFHDSADHLRRLARHLVDKVCLEHQPNLSYPIATLVARRAGMLTVRNDKQAWLDVTLHDLRDIRGDETPCEKLLGELHKAGYDIEGCWWELRTYRNKVRELASFATGMNRVIEDPHRYAVNPEGNSL